MGNGKWEQFGSELMQSIGYAVETGDFSSLNQTVSDTIGRAVNSFTGNSDNSYQNGSNSGNNYQNGQYSGTDYTYNQGNASQYGQSSAGSGNYYQSNANSGTYYGGSRNTAPRGNNAAYTNRQYAAGGTQPLSKQLYGSTIGSKVGGALMVIGGGCGTLVFFLCLCVMWAMPWSPLAAAIVSAIFLALTGGCIGVTVAGARQIGLAQRFGNYVWLLQNREYYEVKQLAQQTGKSAKLVLKDLNKMIKKKWFKQGYLDASGNCLMVTERAHRQYLELMDRTRQQNEENARKQEQMQRQEQMRKQREEERRKQAEEKYASLSPEVRKIVETGDDYVSRIRAINDEIPGEEVSLKISRMEMILDRIFDRVEEHPDSADDVGRLLDYYLPTTMKLLEAYRDMDRQEIQPENVVSSKKEIEETLDTLNTAFEKLLNDLFQETAWDLSSDISVLHTLLAQDGLTGQTLK